MSSGPLLMYISMRSTGPLPLAAASLARSLARSVPGACGGAVVAGEVAAGEGGCADEPVLGGEPVAHLDVLPEEGRLALARVVQHRHVVQHLLLVQDSYPSLFGNESQ